MEPVPEGKRPDERPDLSAAELTYSPGNPVPETPVAIKRRVTNRASEPVEQVEALLMVNGQTLPAKQISVPAEGDFTLLVPTVLPS